MAENYVIEPAAAKIQNVAELRALVSETKSTILADYRGLSVADLTDLRKKLRTADAEFRVVKNTLFRRAADGLLPINEMEAHLSGPTAVSFAMGDSVAAAKVMVDFIKDHKAMSLKAGVMDGKVMSVAQVETLSKTPPREVLISMMLGSLQSPISGLVGTLNGIISNFVFTLQAVADQKAA